MVWNPMYDSSRPARLRRSCRTTGRSPRAILSNQGTFTVQNYAYGGDRGTLTVNGSIAQRYRGAVGKGSERVPQGLRLRHESRELHAAVLPTAGDHTYKVTSQVEVKPAYDASGNPR